MNKQERKKVEAQALIDFPAGTRFYSAGDFSGKVYEVMPTTEFYWNPQYKDCLTSSDLGCVYLRGKWANKLREVSAKKVTRAA